MKARIGDFNQYGTRVTKEGVLFTFAVEQEGDCGLEFYDATTYELLDRMLLTEEYRIGDVYSVWIQEPRVKNMAYRIFQGEDSFVDPYAPFIIGRDIWRDESRADRQYQVYGGIQSRDYSWRYDSPQIKPQDMVMYKLHMRGFSMGRKMAESLKGNDKAIIKSLQGFKDLGITSLEFQPLYDFEEDGKKVNYWGYGDAFYMAPKASYFGGAKRAIERCKKMIDEIHGAGMEIVMEFSFATECSEDYMMDVIWHWIKNYHVDGFHFLGCNIPIERIARDPRFKQTKFFYDNMSWELLQQERESTKKHLFVYDDSFMYACRQLQNHMSGSMVQFANHMRRQNEHYGFVNYMANTSGFTLWDSYSYGEKHNLDNGEDNKDGNNTNYSFNYGVEGESKSRQVKSARYREMRNALSMVCLSQGIPLLVAGDEVANSQQGNNNPYCQDNEIGWVQYGNTKEQKELKRFTEALLRFRKEHPILRSECGMHMNDYAHLGAPDLSYHGKEPWLMSIGDEMKSLGMLYNGAYDKHNGEDIFVLYNYHYEDVEMALPKMRDDKKWALVMNTSSREAIDFVPRELVDQEKLVVPGSSVTLLIAKLP